MRCAGDCRDMPHPGYNELVKLYIQLSSLVSPTKYIAIRRPQFKTQRDPLKKAGVKESKQVPCRRDWRVPRSSSAWAGFLIVTLTRTRLTYLAAVMATFLRAVVNSGRSSPTEIRINSWKYPLARLGFPLASAALAAPYSALNRLGAIFKTAS